MTPPGPRGWLAGQALFSFPREPRAFMRVARKYGDLASWRVGREQFFLINHPDLIREAFVTKHDRFVKGWGPQLGNSILGSGLITAEEALHRSQRRLMLPAFHRQRLEEYHDIAVRHGRALRDRWSERFDVLPEARKTTLAILGDTLFGEDVTPDIPTLAEASDTIFRRFARRMTAFADPLRRLRMRSAKKARSAGEDLREFAARIVAARQCNPGKDFVSMLLAARDDQGQPLPPEQVRDEIVTFVFAGHETVSITLTWVWRELARNPEAQARMHAELDAVLGGNDPRFDDLRRLPYTQGAIAETMRLHPPQWMIGRRAIAPVEIGGCAIPHGAIVLACLPALHRDKRWFEEPEAFRPERWAAGIEKSAPPYTFLPFGAGLRRCIGEGFAWMEATALLAMIASRFEVEPAPRHPMRAETRLMLRPSGNALRFRERMSREC